VIVAGVLGIYPPDYVAAVVAFAFGLAASSFFPAILMGIFVKRMNRAGAITGMIVGILFTACYIIYFKFINTDPDAKEYWLFGISPEGIGVIGMILNFIVAIGICSITKAPPQEVQDLVDEIRAPE
jgi:cation/acetate symporter